MKIKPFFTSREKIVFWKNAAEWTTTSTPQLFREKQLNTSVVVLYLEIKRFELIVGSYSPNVE